MKKTYNSKNLRKLKIISLSVGIASVTTAIAVVTPLVIQKNTSMNSSLTKNSFSAKSSNALTNDNFIQKSAAVTANQLASASLGDYTLPLLTSTNQSNIIGANLQNLYNINGNSILYAQSKGASKIDSIISINQVNNNMNWAVDSASIISAVNTYATSNGGQSINAIFNFNKMVYSAASGSVFLNLYVGNSGSESSGYTVIVKISNISSGSPTISNYYNASTTANASTLGVQKNSNFSQFVIQADGSSPTLFLIKDKYTQADKSTSSLGKVDYNLVTFSISNNNITGSLIRTPLSLSTSDINFLNTNSSNALYVTNSNWTSGGGNGGLMVVLCRSSVSNLADFATMYSFAATGTTFLNSPSSQVLNLALSQFNASQPVILNLETIGSSLFLIGSQKNNNASSSAFNSNGSIASFQISININGNNAPINLTTYSNSNLAYGNGQQILGIVNVNNTSNLPTGAQYIALTSSGALVILNDKFNYLNELATIPNSFFPTGVNVLRIIANGFNYLVYLSNGSIIVFNNTGYLGYLSSIVTNNTVQAITPISFVPQNNVANGVAIFTQPLNQFLSNVTSQTNQLIFSLINTTNTSANYLVQSQTVTNNNSTDPFSAQVTLDVYQQLFEVNDIGVPISSTVISTVFLGSHTYNIYNKAGAITSNPISNLPESLQNVLPSQITASQAQQYLLTISNIDQNDIFTNGANNITVTLTPQDATGALIINVTIGSYWAITATGTAQQQNTSLSFTINGFVTGPAENQLDYTLNPTPVSDLKSKYFNVSPDTLTDKDVLVDFIKLSSYLANLQGTTINIVPDDATGIATITITFNFPNSFFTLAPNSGAVLVTQNSITWNTPAVFAANPSLNDSILFSFNSSQTIATSFPQTITQLPSSIQSIVSSMTSLSSQVQWLIDKGFINVSDFVKNDISAVTIVTGPSSDFTGSFSLLIELNNPLPNTTQKTYLYNYNGFQQTPSGSINVNSVFTVTPMSNETYLSKFETTANFNSIFSVEPSLVTKQNILNSLYAPTSNPDQLTGYLIDLNPLAATSQYTLNLTPDDANGSLLITLVFSDFLELNPTTNAVQTVKNKRYVFIYNGFVKSNNIQLFSLNWKSPEKLLVPNSKDTSLLSLSPTEAIKDISTGTTTPTAAAIDQLKVFAELSKAAENLYQNAQLIDLKLTPNDLNGTIVVDVTFTNWNGVASPQQFSQTFSGFLISESVIKTTLQSIKPFVSNMEQLLTKFKESIPSEISQEQWLSLFNFTTTILNSMQKKIYVLFNNETGYVSFVIYAKPNNTSASTVATNPSAANGTTSSSTTANNTQFILLEQTTTPDNTTTPDSTSTSDSTSGLNFSEIPKTTLESEGFIEVNTSEVLYNGFKQQHLVYTAPDNVLSIILGVIIPSVILIPLILLLAISKNKKAIKNVKAKIAKRLEEEYSREKETDEDDK